VILEGSCVHTRGGGGIGVDALGVIAQLPAFAQDGHRHLVKAGGNVLLPGQGEGGGEGCGYSRGAPALCAGVWRCWCARGWTLSPPAASTSCAAHSGRGGKGWGKRCGYTGVFLHCVQVCGAAGVPEDGHCLLRQPACHALHTVAGGERGGARGVVTQGCSCIVCRCVALLVCQRMDIVSSGSQHVMSCIQWQGGKGVAGGHWRGCSGVGA
jgi:hypothetical protein